MKLIALFCSIVYYLLFIGKSHTIFGSKNNNGLLTHCARLLLSEMTFEYQLVCSFYEIYNNQVYDLVNSGKRFKFLLGISNFNFFTKKFFDLDYLYEKMVIIMLM